MLLWEELQNFRTSELLSLLWSLNFDVVVGVDDFDDEGDMVFEKMTEKGLKKGKKLTHWEIEKGCKQN